MPNVPSRNYALATAVKNKSRYQTFLVLSNFTAFLIFCFKSFLSIPKKICIHPQEVMCFTHFKKECKGNCCQSCCHKKKHITGRVQFLFFSDLLRVLAKFTYLEEDRAL